MLKRNRSTNTRDGVRRVGIIAAAIATAWLGSTTAYAVEYTSSVIASGLNNPRGLAFAPDGSLYIAEGGVPGGAGPSTPVRGESLIYTETGSVTRYFNGSQTRVMTNLPSTYIQATGETVGPNDVSFSATGTAYVTIGAGVNPNVRATDLGPNGVKLGHVNYSGGSYDVSAHEAAQNPAGGPLDSDPWRTVSYSGGLLVTDAGGNSLLNIAPDGTITTITTFASRDIGGGFPSDPVPTGLAIGQDGAYYVGELSGFPFTPGASQIYRVLPNGDKSVYATGFTQITDLEFDAAGNLYVLEYDANGLLVPGDAGALIKIAPDGTRTTLFSTGLVEATGLAIGADGAFYVSNFGAQSGTGEVLRIAPVPEPQTYALIAAGLVAVGVIARKRRRS